jgi:hypothetical protein
MVSGDQFSVHSLTDAQINSRQYDEMLVVACVERQFKMRVKEDVFFEFETGEVRAIPPDYTQDQIDTKLDPGIDPETGVPKPQRYIILNDQWIDVIHCHVMTFDEEFLFDERMPYDHFTPIPYFPSLVNGVTSGMVEYLIEPQMILNKTTSLQLEAAAKAANSAHVVNFGNIIGGDGDRKNVEAVIRGTGGVIAVQNADDVSAVHNTVQRIAPDQTPQTADRLAFLVSEHMDGISGSSAYTRGNARADVAGKAAQVNAEMAQRSSASILTNYEYMWTILARNVLSVMQKYMTSARTLRVLRGRGSHGYETLNINTVNAAGEWENDLTAGEYSVEVVIHANAGTRDQRQYEDVMTINEILTARGVPVPLSLLISAMYNIADRDGVQQEIEKEQARVEEQQAQMMAQQQELEDRRLRVEEAKIAAAQETAAAQRIDSETGERKLALQEVKEDRDYQIRLRQLEQDDKRINQERVFKIAEIGIKQKEAAAKVAAASQQRKPTT